jgi:hypothetical protein
MLIATLNPANAVWKGFDDPNNKRAVPIFMEKYGNYCNGSGFLYSSRIVFTVAHGIFRGDDRQSEPKVKFEKLWVGVPGKKVAANSERIESAKILVPENYKHRNFWLGGKRLNRENDFAIIVLKEPITVDSKPVELLTPELHQQYIANNEEVSLMGYGGNDVDTLNKTCDIITPKSMTSNVISNNLNLGDIEWTARLNMKVLPGKPNICDGDSGAGYVKILEDKYIYLGAQSSGISNHNCGSWAPDINSETINGTDPVYLYLDLVKQAEDYVVANPYVAPVAEKTIKCAKGKKTKKITSANPKCPKGFKEKM